MHAIRSRPVATPSSRDVVDPAQLDYLRHDLRDVRASCAAAPRLRPERDAACGGRRAALMFLAASTLPLGTLHKVTSRTTPAPVTHTVPASPCSSLTPTSAHRPAPPSGLRTAILASLSRITQRILPQAAWGAAITDGVAASGSWLDFMPMAPPEPVRFPRRGLDQRFAVLLMQSSYRAVDALDFIPMVRLELGTSLDVGPLECCAASLQ